MKKLLFDHIAHYSENPKNTRNKYKLLGFQTIEGGQHPNWGTYNSLCFFGGLRYIEWIGLTDLKIAKKSENILISK